MTRFRLVAVVKDGRLHKSTTLQELRLTEAGGTVLQGDPACDLIDELISSEGKGMLRAIVDGVDRVFVCVVVRGSARAHAFLKEEGDGESRCFGLITRLNHGAFIVCKSL